MNFIINLLVLIITGGIAVIFAVNLIINLIRSSRVNKVIKQGTKYVTGKIIELQETKNRVIIKVEYVSDANRNKFIDVFELTKKEFADKYYEGQEVKIYYPDVNGLKKVYCFPTYLEGQKQKMEAGPIFTDSFLLLGGLYIFVMLLISMLTKKEASDGLLYMGLQWDGLPLIALFSRLSNTVLTDEAGNILAVTTGIYLLIIFLFYFMLYTYVYERLTGMSSQHKQSYLKLCGIKGMAEVKTFKFSRSKGPNGQKESLMKIEFYTNNGDKINCDLSSYLYSETQEQYVDILYDEKNPKNCVYMKK